MQGTHLGGSGMTEKAVYCKSTAQAAALGSKAVYQLLQIAVSPQFLHTYQKVSSGRAFT